MKGWAESPMESAFAAILRSLTLLQRDQLSKTAKLLISGWNFLDIADEIAGVGAVSSGHQIAEQHERLFNPVKNGLNNLCTVCGHKVFSMLIAVLFDEIAFVLLKVLLNLSAEARQDVHLVFEDSSHGNLLAGDLYGFAAKECSTLISDDFYLFTLFIFQVHAAGLAIGSYAKHAAAKTFMGDILAKTLMVRSKASMAILNQLQDLFQCYQSMFCMHYQR